MADLRYATGTCSVSADGTTVSFSSALLLQHAMTGDRISINRQPAVDINSVTDQMHMEIDPWPHASVTSVPYIIYQCSILRASRGQLAADVSKLNASLNASGYFYFVPDDVAEPDPSDGDEDQHARQDSTGKQWVKQGGVWVYQGVLALFKTMGMWSAEYPYALNDVTERVGKLWRSRQSGNLNHIPEASPTYWEVFLAGGDAYDIQFWDSGRSGSAELVLKVVFTKTVTFYAGLVDSIAVADAASTGTVYYSLNRDGLQFAYVQFSPGNPVAIFATGETDTTFVPGDVLTIYAPEIRDATLSGVSLTLSGYRN